MSVPVGSKPIAASASPISALFCVRMRMPLQSAGRADRTHLVRDVAKAVVPEAEHAIRRALVHPRADVGAEWTFERADDRRPVSHHERQLEDFQLGNPRGEAQGGDVARRELAAFDQRRQFAGRVAVQMDVALQLERHAIAEPLLQALSETRRSAGIDGCRPLVAAEADRDPLHWLVLRWAGTIAGRRERLPRDSGCTSASRNIRLGVCRPRPFPVSRSPHRIARSSGGSVVQSSIERGAARVPRYRQRLRAERGQACRDPPGPAAAFRQAAARRPSRTRFAHGAAHALALAKRSVAPGPTR